MWSSTFEHDEPGCFGDDRVVLCRGLSGCFEEDYVVLLRVLPGGLKCMVLYFEENDRGCFEENGAVL